jgi:hypothetical protein
MLQDRSREEDRLGQTIGYAVMPTTVAVGIIDADPVARANPLEKI